MTTAMAIAQLREGNVVFDLYQKTDRTAIDDFLRECKRNNWTVETTHIDDPVYSTRTIIVEHYYKNEQEFLFYFGGLVDAAENAPISMR